MIFGSINVNFYSLSRLTKSYNFRIWSLSLCRFTTSFRFWWLVWHKIILFKFISLGRLNSFRSLHVVHFIEFRMINTKFTQSFLLASGIFCFLTKLFYLLKHLRSRISFMAIIWYSSTLKRLGSINTNISIILNSSNLLIIFQKLMCSVEIWSTTLLYIWSIFNIIRPFMFFTLRLVY